MLLDKNGKLIYQESLQGICKFGVLALSKCIYYLITKLDSKYYLEIFDLLNNNKRNSLLTINLKFFKIDYSYISVDVSNDFIYIVESPIRIIVYEFTNKSTLNQIDELNSKNSVVDLYTNSKYNFVTFNDVGLIDS